MTEAQLRRIIREELEPLRKQIDLQHKLLTGNGQPERGVILRLDRLEQSESRRTWWIRAAVGAALSALAAQVVAVFR